MFTRPNCTPRRAGFTLVEMLVVMVIIGVLAGLLLPALLGAKERGYTAYCQNNLHQIALAMRKYCFLYEGRFPAIYDSMWSGWPWPVEYMAKMMGYDAQISKGDPPPKVILCPSCGAGPKDGSGYLCRNYAINGHLDSWPETGYIVDHQDYETRVNAYASFPSCPWNDTSTRQWGGWANWQPYQIEFVRCPERVAVFSDSVDEVDPSCQGWWYPYYPRICATVCYGCRPTRHMNGGNVAYLDGHVEWLPRSRFLDTTAQCNWLIDPDTHNSSAWWDSNFGN